METNCFPQRNKVFNQGKQVVSFLVTGVKQVDKQKVKPHYSLKEP
jgi:hypothetical protein